ncbi:DUF3987 domain-containing protein [Streptomyces sp. WZ-12]|uniref:DUF3987 domain-containing protein n=1 Tax=Streptomyces sp. WZ-12 TaxID=3030210 RepID=UPI0023816AD8|nr:DUF3987 domain-containing protein [Streptomyces sp. WZ-12]
MSEHPVEGMTVGKVREILDLVMPETEADPAGVLAALLSQVSCMVGDKVMLNIGGREMPVSVWTLLIGATGKGRKGTAYGMAARVCNVACPDFLTDHESSGASSGSGIIRAFVKRRESALAAMRDAEENGREYAGLSVTDTRMLLVEAEYETVIKRGKRDATLQGVMRKAWDGADLQNMVADGGVLRSPRFVVHGHSTPRGFRDNISATDVAGGTYNRMVIQHVTRSKRLSMRHVINEDSIKEAGAILARAVAFTGGIDEITLSEEAIDLFDDGLRDEIDEYRCEDEYIEDFLPRAVENVWRVGAIYALINLRDEISVADIEAAWSFVRHGLDSVAHIMGEGADMVSGETEEDKILKVLRRNPGGITGTDIFKLTGVPARYTKAWAEKRDDIDMWRGLGSLSGGRKPTMFRLMTAEEMGEAGEEPTASVPEQASGPRLKAIGCETPVASVTMSVEDDNEFADLLN